MGTEAAFHRPRQTIFNLGLSCLIAGGSFIQNPPSNEACRIPCTVSCVSRLIDLRRLRHPNLARYLDAQCDKHRRIYLVTEHYSSDFSQLNPPIKTPSDFNWLLKRFQDCMQGLIYLESNGIVIGSLNPSSLLIDNCENVKITNYGAFYASRWGLDLDFPVIDLRYSSPEALLCSESCSKLSQDCSSIEPPCPLDSRSDLWSLALIFTEILHFPLLSFNPRILLRSLLKSLNSSHSFFDQVVRLNQTLLSQLNERIDFLDKIFRVCLILDARQRPSLTDIQNHFCDLEIVSFESSDKVRLECMTSRVN